jgi:hypothetical protein
MDTYDRISNRSSLGNTSRFKDELCGKNNPYKKQSMFSLNDLIDFSVVFIR